MRWGIAVVVASLAACSGLPSISVAASGSAIAPVMHATTPAARTVSPGPTPMDVRAVAAAEEAARAATRQAEFAFRQTVEARRQADYALWTLVASALGTGLLIVTVYYTHRSLKLGRQSLDHARDLAKIELRAYVDLSESDIEFVQENTFGKTYDLKYVLKNFGQTPGIDVTVTARTDLSPKRDDVAYEHEPGDTRFGVIAPSDWVSGLLRYYLDYDTDRRIDLGELTFTAIIEAKYRDVFGAEHETRLVLDLSQKNPTLVDGTHILT